jgi:hypothetical protein
MTIIKRLGAPRRLRQVQNGSKTKVVNRIRLDRLEKIEAELNKALPISASDAEETNWLLIYEENHPDDFIGVPHRDGVDLDKMSNLERHEFANRIPPKKQ